MEFLSDLYDLGPSGPLRSPATITIRLSRAVPANNIIVVATREATSQPWDYLPATLAPDRTRVTFATTHLSIFGVLTYDLNQAVETFKSDFVDGIDGGATSTVARPACGSDQAARSDGYAITSDNTDTVYWCFGEDATGRRLLKVTDHRRYPLLITHPGMSVIQDAYDWGQWSSLSRLAPGNYAIIAPGGTAVFNADLNPGGSEGVQTRIDGLGQSLYALQAGVTTLIEILTRFGAGSGITAAEIAGKLLTAQSCLTSIGKGSGDIIAGCLSAADILDAFGAKGLLVAPIMVAGPVIAFFHSQLNAIVDQFNGHSKYRIVITRAKPTVTVAAFAGQWFGHTRGVTITADGQGNESVGGGCCDPIVDLTFQLSNPHGTPNDATATMTVTSVQVHDWQDPQPPPAVGQKATVRLRDGVITEPLTDTNYCDYAADSQGTCGA